MTDEFRPEPSDEVAALVEPRQHVSLNPEPVPQSEMPLWSRVRSTLTPRKIRGVYVLIVMVVVFSIWLPSTFPNSFTLWEILNSNAVPALAALSLVIPLSAGVFDI